MKVGSIQYFLSSALSVLSTTPPFACFLKRANACTQSCSQQDLTMCRILVVIHSLHDVPVDVIKPVSAPLLEFTIVSRSCWAHCCTPSDRVVASQSHVLYGLAPRSARCLCVKTFALSLLCSHQGPLSTRKLGRICANASWPNRLWWVTHLTL